jgi:hypothetical protein
MVIHTDATKVNDIESIIAKSQSLILENNEFRTDCYLYNVK